MCMHACVDVSGEKSSSIAPASSGIVRLGGKLVWLGENGWRHGLKIMKMLESRSKVVMALGRGSNQSGSWMSMKDDRSSVQASHNSYGSLFFVVCIKSVW